MCVCLFGPYILSVNFVFMMCTRLRLCPWKGISWNQEFRRWFTMSSSSRCWLLFISSTSLPWHQKKWALHHIYLRDISFQHIRCMYMCATHVPTLYADGLNEYDSVSTGSGFWSNVLYTPHHKNSHVSCTLWFVCILWEVAGCETRWSYSGVTSSKSPDATSML